MKEKTGQDFVASWRGGQLVIAGYGGNNPVYRLDRNGTISTVNKTDINNLVTKVKVYGRQDDAGRSQVEAVVAGDTRFGTLQDIILRDSNKSLADAKAEADTLLARRGRPEEMIIWNGPDLPFLRKGDKVEIEAGNLQGFFFVEAVVHFGKTRRMKLTLRRVETATPSDAGQGADADGTFRQGDSIILNGPVFRDSFGAGQGRTFTDFRSTITIVAPASRYAPYHIGQVGWARGDFVTDGAHKFLYGSGVEAWKFWCIKTILTERFAHLGYSNNAGIEAEQVFAENDQQAIESSLERTITEALLADPAGRTIGVRNFRFTWANGGESLFLECKILGIDGNSATISARVRG
ncbi:MAG: DUF2634 domain-containing protein [Clostridiales bacterium]|nr:DUF2634 domain-containing protein [Clostridiales bacterium]